MRKLLVADASLAPDAAFFAPEMREEPYHLSVVIDKSLVQRRVKDCDDACSKGLKGKPHVGRCSGTLPT